MSVSNGGNIEGSRENKTIEIFGCKVYANSNLANQIPQSSGILYANNLSNFVDYLLKTPNLNKKDEIIKATLI